MNKTVFFFGILLTIFANLFANFDVTTKTAIAFSTNNSNFRREDIIAQNNPDSQSRQDLSKIIFFVGLIGAGALLLYFFQSRQNSKSNFTAIKSDSDTQLLDRVSPKLRRQLLRQINDPKTVNRLLQGIQQHNPHRSPNWLAEKAIYDLRRGR